MTRIEAGRGPAFDRRGFAGRCSPDGEEEFHQFASVVDVQVGQLTGFFVKRSRYDGLDPPAGEGEGHGIGGVRSHLHGCGVVR